MGTLCMAHIYYRKSLVGNPSSVDEYDYVGEVPSDDLEQVFRMMNHVDGSGVEQCLKTFNVRSMSVGDIAIINSEPFYCSNLGWAPMLDNAIHLMLGLAIAEKHHISAWDETRMEALQKVLDEFDADPIEFEGREMSRKQVLHIVQCWGRTLRVGQQ